MDHCPIRTRLYDRLGLDLKEFPMRHALLLIALTSSFAAAQTFPYDYIHLNVSDPAAAANWYARTWARPAPTKAPT
jgi:hypothetical protein